MFAEGRQGLVRDQLVAWAQSDHRVTGAALTGSAAEGTDDRWSDVDLFFGVGQDATVDDVLLDWTSRIYEELHAVHHFDLHGGGATYRAFLLDDGLEVDLGFTFSDHFGPVGSGAFNILFGAASPRLSGVPDVDHIIGLSWHHAMHARISIERNAPWQAEHWISALRDHVVSLGSIRHGLPELYAKGADQLPEDERALITKALVTSLDGRELARALSAAVRALLEEIQHTDRQTTDKLRPLLESWAGADR